MYMNIKEAHYTEIQKKEVHIHNVFNTIISNTCHMPPPLCFESKAKGRRHQTKVTQFYSLNY